ncbi:MAG: hypothetical protein ACD_80C00010G0002 [uncultured bacterium (gcode 4)]|uniref:Uncharacterized protein n=1 Tax=uncultured bacterium (gcode 4) TaxID=1234023 RepID=K1XZB7_9BACT|nr:MAG: hypothetical protein ACD_80C00010G0002 [uncultured bacterium (gcode 4)]HBB04784.1 hypothetical protein [Candidatus Gracilibacteria bacterium]
MKNITLLLELREATKKAKEAVLKRIQLEEEKKKENERKEIRKQVEKKLRNLERDMMSDASCGNSYTIVHTVQERDKKSNKFEDWSIELQEIYKFLEEKGLEPEVRKRIDGDRPTAYSVEECPYAIIVSWEE